ncbi:hypothetical protein FACS1894109_20190 [Spirochaetia bacterium]|nr:hypothetical protein FACS1894109_20190 [Spirochaetia bacterium]
MSNIELRSIRDLLKMHFLIPSYQRGYRWSDTQVVALLNDIREFQEKEEKKPGEFYCLQPIIVKKLDESENKWEVIDGQQRLTTIFIILSFLEDAIKSNLDSIDLFTIEYQTRQEKDNDSKVFLSNIKNVTEVSKINVDFFHMSKAFLMIKEWFRKSDILRGKYVEALLDSRIKDGVDKSNNVRFIWYEIDSVIETDPIAVFTRINMGKIPLTSSELIKALLFLSNESDEEEKRKYQLRLGYDCDEMENALQEEGFWHFLTYQNNLKENRIELLFKLIADKYEPEVKIRISNNDNYRIFFIFNELILKKTLKSEQFPNTTDYLWDEIKSYFRLLKEWYEDNTFYHLIGYLINISTKIETIKAIFDDKDTENKNVFIEKLKKLIKTEFDSYSLKELSYEDTNHEILNHFLLLFNVISTMNSNVNRFPFNRYSNEQWSLEHIHAQNSAQLVSDKQRRLFVSDQRIYFENHHIDEYIKRIDEIMSDTQIDATKFQEFEKEIFKHFADDSYDYSIGSIENLALLRKDDNSSLNNNIFPIKRDKIKQLDEKGSFIPICTKNVFLKYYSKTVEQNVKWSKQDMDDYFDEMKNTLKEFINQGDTE